MDDSKVNNPVTLQREMEPKLETKVKSQPDTAKLNKNKKRNKKRKEKKAIRKATFEFLAQHTGVQGTRDNHTGQVIQAVPGGNNIVIPPISNPIKLTEIRDDTPPPVNAAVTPGLKANQPSVTLISNNISNDTTI